MLFGVPLIDFRAFFGGSTAAVFQRDGVIGEEGRSGGALALCNLESAPARVRWSGVCEGSPLSLQRWHKSL